MQRNINLYYIRLILFLHPRDCKENIAHCQKKIPSLVNAINNEINIQPLYWITARLGRDGLFFTVWTHHLSVWAQKVLKFNQRPPSWTDVLAQDVALGSSAASSRARWHFRISYFCLDRIWCIRDDITSDGVRPSSTFNKCLCLINTGAFHDGRASLLFQGAVRFVLFVFLTLEAPSSGVYSSLARQKRLSNLPSTYLPTPNDSHTTLGIRQRRRIKHLALVMLRRRSVYLTCPAARKYALI